MHICATTRDSWTLHVYTLQKTEVYSIALNLWHTQVMSLITQHMIILEIRITQSALRMRMLELRVAKL